MVDDLYKAVNSEINTILSKKFLETDVKEKLRVILNCIDLTSLNGYDTNADIIELCRKAKSFSNNAYNIPNVAAVCVYPAFVEIAAFNLKNTSINLACVENAFPSGLSPLDIRVSGVSRAVADGANEIDMVISRGKVFEEDFEYIHNEIAEIKKACAGAKLKVILETGELGSMENIRKAAQIAINAGADFIKTSTGKVNPGATKEAFYIILQVIKEHYDKSGEIIGVKPAGGISDIETALEYFIILEKVLGEKWLNNKYFRIGASKLATKVVERLMS